MISFLVGIIEEKSDSTLTLDVNGVGYELGISRSTYLSLPAEGERAKVLTFMSVREDGVSLFGFATKEEKELFLKLTSVSGIGPRVAIGILSGMPISELIKSILQGDLRSLSAIKGLGKKTAERLCLELKDKLSPVGVLSENEKTFDYDEDAVALATDTLISLGVNKNEAYNLAKSNAGPNATAEEIISKSLRGYRG
ncbi:MAG TPA: Holliday junction branch migration protein RuvA [Clostridiales bacterium]|nr:Holliday junction branch migration protein RuvA [Clostridiales bacterium]